MVKKAKTSPLRSWIEVPEGSDFPLYNIPFGVGRRPNGKVRCFTRIGNTAVDLYMLASLGLMDELGIPDLRVFKWASLNDFFANGRERVAAARERIINIFSENNPVLRTSHLDKTKVLLPADQVQMLMPIKVRDYTDFYSSKEHAEHVGAMFRDKSSPLQPNWLHLPVGYHGRTSSIVVSGTAIRRPKGQSSPSNAGKPVFGPSKALDFEAETAFITCSNTELGQPIEIGQADQHIIGMLIFNDLSARDIQQWEYVPLGPFQGKSFGSVISPWVVTMEALEPFRVAGPEQNPKPMPYLQTRKDRNFDICIEASIRTPEGSETLICKTNTRYLYWSIDQQLTHQTLNGCNIRVCDLYASGAISGPEPDSYGSMLELSWNGSNPIHLEDGTQRTFLNDHDTLIIRAFAEKQGMRIGFGESVTTVLPAL
ncbi:MAG: fumarylacetoacetase [Bacteroidales bacterium]|nr:fumarylacetoacetase [Bacteroidales bacterium]